MIVVAQRKTHLWPPVQRFLNSWVIPAILCLGLIAYWMYVLVISRNIPALFGLAGLVLTMVVIGIIEVAIREWVDRLAEHYRYWIREVKDKMEAEGYPPIVQLRFYLRGSVSQTRFLWMYFLPALCVLAYTSWFYVGDFGTTFVVNDQTSLSSKVLIAERLTNRVLGFSNDQSKVWEVVGTTSDGVRVTAMLSVKLRMTDNEADLLSFTRSVRGQPNEELAAHLFSAFNRGFATYVAGKKHSELGDQLALEVGTVTGLTDEGLRGLAVVWDGGVEISDLHPTLKKLHFNVTG